MVEQKMFEEKMFADSLLETSWAQRTRRSWTTLTSFGVQAVVVALLLLLPLLKTVGLPSTRPISTPISVGLPPAEPAAPRPPAPGASVVVSNYDKGRLMMPTRVPPLIQPGVDEASAQGPGGPDVGVIGTGPGPGLPNGLLLPFRDGTNPIVLPKPAPITRAIRTSIMQEGNLIRRLQPNYPYAAKVAHVQGQVVLAAIISKAGTIENLRALSGHPLLVGAAIEAVSQWRYRPYILNNEPVEVETQVTVNFTLSGN
jgi:protein TonB